MADDIEIARVFVSSAANGTVDNTPNEVGGNRRARFFVNIQVDAADHVGDLKAAYQLLIRAHSTAGNNTTFAPLNLAEQVADGADDWRQVTPGANDGYIKRSTYRINASDFDTNGLYEFIAVLRLGDGSVSVERSNEFFIA